MQKKDDDDMTKDNGDVTKDDGDKQEGEQEKKPTAKPVSLVTTGVKKSSWGWRPGTRVREIS